MIKYDELISSGVLDNAGLELSAHVVAVVVPDDEPYDGSFGAERVRDGMTVVNQSSETRRARSSHEPPATTRPTINTNRIGHLTLLRNWY